MTVQVIPQVKPKKKYWPVQDKNTKRYNYGPKFVRFAMPWFETYFYKYKKYPPNDAIMEQFGCSLEEVTALNLHKFWLGALDRRGITKPGYEEWYLTERQTAAIAIITNFSDVRDPQVKLAQIGVSVAELDGWHQNPHFQTALRDRADSVLDNVSADATAELARQVRQGSFPALKFYFEITGRAQSPEAVNVKQAMALLIEAVQKHVKDPEVLKAIADEVQTLRSLKGI